jgi:hypothetical protein
MSAGEVLVRSLLAGLAIGVPAYCIGMWRYSGRRVPPPLIVSTSIASGFTAGLAVLATRAPWPATVGIGALFAILNVGVMALMVKARDLLVLQSRGESRGPHVRDGPT